MKRFLKILAAFLVLLVIAAGIGISRINTDSNKQAIASAVLSTTGYELVIGGDLSVSFFPSLGLSLSDVRLRNPAYPQELLSTSSVVLSVELASLFANEIQVNEISAQDFHANYFINANGTSIWEVPSDGNPTTSSTATSAGTGEPEITTLSVERLRIANASIDIQDQSQGTQYRLDNLSLDSTDTNIEGRPFSIDLNFDYENNSMSAPVPITTRADVVADINAGNFTVSDLQLSVTPMLVTGEAEITGLQNELNFTGTFTAEPFDVISLLTSLGLREEEETFSLGLDAHNLLDFALSINGDAQQLNIPSFALNFAGAAIESDATVRFATDFSPMNVSYNINAGNLDLTPFFPASVDSEEVAVSEDEPDATPSVNPAAQYQPETELPVELLNAMTVLGSASIESIRVNDMLIEDINVFTNIEDGLMDIEVPPVSVFEGSMQSTLRLNAQASTPSLEITALSSDLNLVNLAPSLSRFNTVTGFLQSESTYTASGSTASNLLASLSGNTAFSITENSVDIGVIKQVFTAIAALSPTGEAIQQWPDVIRFSEMSGYHILDNGFTESQELKLRMDNFDVSGSGGFDLEAGTFDYDLLFTVLGEPYTQTIPINELYHDVSWPVDCSAAFNEEVNRYCRPDFTQVREIFTQIGTNAARNRLQDVITDQVPEELQDSARGLLRSIFN